MITIIMLISVKIKLNCTLPKKTEFGKIANEYPGVNISHYSQIKYLGKVSIFWSFGEEFLRFDESF